ncbi:hypothetical protein Q3O59_06845 [Alkalimonas delamerensis]|uniref:Uncharacterized protein n=1 Tax=Alkalimonas delamerensis TaxID=265981 RepID=A0ABT9GP61_9GAMM|nr:hypothetical protein [Alkalimonas delamerensis]MDP4528749.1 hypothetical protein [Alkalimonas delamerensis]
MQVLIFLLIFFFVFPLCATQQIKETFVFDGEIYGLEMGPGYKSPLEALYSFDEIRLMLDLKGACTANWRGYKGSWEVKSNQLLLNSLVKDACSKNPPLVDSVLFFGVESYPVKANWFNGQIKVRLSQNRYKFCNTNSHKEKMIGYEYDAMVYEFSAGEFIYKSKQVVGDVWEFAMSNCSY